MSKRKVVMGIVTNGCDDKEYKAIYRKKTHEDRVKKTIELGKLDTDFYNKLIKTLKADPKTRRMIRFFLFIGFMGGVTTFTVQIAVTSILYNIFL